MKQLFKKTVLILFGAVLAVAALEGLLRLAPEPDAPEPIADETKSLYEYDRLLGWRLRPGVAARQAIKDFDVTYRTNAEGFRDDRDWETKNAAGGPPRVALFGDSFAFGVGLPLEKTFGGMVGKDGACEVLNFGVSGYDPGQYLLSLTNEGLRHEPDVVIMAFCLCNDLDDLPLDHQSQGSKRFKPYFTVDETGDLKINNVPVPEGAATEERQDTRLKQNLFSSLFGWMLDLRTVRLAKNPLKENLYPFLARARLVKSADDYTSTLDVLEAIFRQADAATFNRFGVLIIPSANVKHNYLERELAGRVAERLDAAGIPYGNLVPAVTQSSEQLYFPHEGHWNERGAALAAQALEGLLKTVLDPG